MNLLTKKIDALTPEDLGDLFKPIGTADLPYPSTRFDVDATGKLEADIGVIADDTNPLAVYSNRSHAYVVGQFHRRMAIPSLLHIQKEVVLGRAPESTSRVIMVVGKPGPGKSELGKMIADACDDRGAEIVDCGGHYLGDLLWEQVIDYGEDFKTALTSRVRAGLLTETSVRIFEEQFAQALVKDAGGKITDIIWDKMSAPRNIGTADEPVFESTTEAAERTMSQIETTIAKYEGIPQHVVNNIGMRKVPGIAKRLHDEGKTGIFDEYTKAIEGSDDSLQTFLQYLNGEIDEFTTTNSMKTGGREETYSYTLRRSEMKLGFYVCIFGNSEEDGFSTHMLSKSAYSRIPYFEIGDPLLIDWQHRFSQAVTGLPLSTEYMLFSAVAKDDPQEFAKMLVELLLIGLSDEERAKVPPHQLMALGDRTLQENGEYIYHWEQTRDAIEKYAGFYMYWSKIVDPQSDLYDPAKEQNSDNIEHILPEISLAYRDKCAIDLRNTIHDMGEALKIKPEVRKIDGNTRLHINFSAVGRRIEAPTINREKISSELGSRLAAVLLERIGVTTLGRPNTCAALVKEMCERGILILPGQTVRTTSAADLLNQDALASVGGTKKVLALREVLIDRLRQFNPALRNKPEDDVVSMDWAIAASEELLRLSFPRGLQRKGRIIILGKDLRRAFIQAIVVDGAGGRNKPEVSELVRASDFLESLRIPAIANMNMRGVWADTISTERLVKPSNETTPVVEIAEGKHSSGIGITTVMMQSVGRNASVPVHIMRDDARGKCLIVSDDVGVAARAVIGKDKVVVAYGDADAEDQVNAFIKASLEVESRKPAMAELERQLTYAFLLRAGHEDKLEPLARMMTTRNLPVEAPVFLVSRPG